MAIHPTAIIDASAEIEPTVEIGAYAIIEARVRIGAGTVVHPHGYVAYGTTLGRECQVHPYAVVGHAPQDTKFKGEPSFTQVGDGTVIREGASIHRGTAPGSSTIVGRRCFLMSTAHIAHNCVVGDDVTFVNNALLAGHVLVGNRAFFGGGAMVHQFSRIGELAMVAGAARIPMDVPPFMLTGVDCISGINIVGMRRAGMNAEERLEIRRCFRALYLSGQHFRAAVERVAEIVRTDAGSRLVAFLLAPSKRGVTGGPQRRARRARAWQGSAQQETE